MKYSGKNIVKPWHEIPLMLGLASALLLPCVLAHAEKAPVAKAIAWNCQSCHNAESGDQQEGIPNLLNLTRQQLYQALLDFKYKPSTATLMPRLAKGYRDEELRAVAEALAP